MIQARDLRKTYGGLAAVDDLSFDVTPGLVTGFLGPNGAGKSTTIRLMLGLDSGEGTTLFDGVRYRDLRHPLREVGAVLDERCFHPGRRARSHLMMLAASQGIGRARVDEVIEWVGLGPVARKRTRHYSLGMTQRLALAAALLGDPRVLILDEPANGLDPAGIQWLRGFLKAFAAEGRAVFVSSHQLGEMAQIADHLIVIDHGRLVADEPTEVFAGRSSRANRVLVRTPHVERMRRLLTEVGAAVERCEDHQLAVGGVDKALIGELAFRNGIVLHELTVTSAPLEDAFLELTSPGRHSRIEAFIPAQATDSLRTQAVVADLAAGDCWEASGSAWGLDEQETQAFDLTEVRNAISHDTGPRHAAGKGVR
ncbi:MAG: ABC transporter ATP-binding protein [Sporichthyaceae bacterium]